MAINTAPTRHSGPVGLPDTATSAAAAVVLAVLLVATIAYLDYAAAYVVFPGNQDYGEGPILFQIEWLREHGTIYLPIAEPPYAVSNYPPVFHYTTWLMTNLVPDSLMAGRLVSFIAGLVSAALIFTLVYRLTGCSHARVSRAFGGCLAALFFLSHYSVTLWSVMARVDMLALALGLLGMLVFELARLHQSRLLACLSGLIFVLAVYTKQNMVGAAAAALLTALLFDRRLLLAALAASIPTGLIAMALLQATSGGEFLLHAFYYNINEFRWSLIAPLSMAFAALNPIEILILVFGSAYLLVRWRQRTLAQRSAANAGSDFPLVLFSIFAVFGMLSAVTSLKEGAAANYYLEFQAAGSLLLGLVATRIIRLMNERQSDPHYWRYRAAAILGLGMLAWQTIYGWESKYRPPYEIIVPNMERVAELARTLEGPVISEDMVLLHRIGKPLYFQPFIMTRLAEEGQWNPGPFLAKLRSGEIAMIVLTHDIGSRHYRNRFSPEFTEALQSRYRFVQRFGHFAVYVPI